jgi:hypothetical protein
MAKPPRSGAQRPLRHQTGTSQYFRVLGQAQPAPKRVPNEKLYESARQLEEPEKPEEKPVPLAKPLLHGAEK